MALNAKATQEFVPIKDVRSGVVVLNDGSLRALLMASSINLSLKSADEQQGTIMQFQNFLNSLDFSVQIIVQSRRLDIKPYIALLEDRKRAQLEPLLKIQTAEYINFIREFTELNTIMTKQFFIVIPYSSAPLSSSGALTKTLFGGTAKTGSNAGKSDATIEFEEKLTQLSQRVAVVQQGLGSLGVRSVQLQTDEAVEMYYKVFNPGDIATGVRTQLKNITPDQI